MILLALILEAIALAIRDALQRRIDRRVSLHPRLRHPPGGREHSDHRSDQ